MALVLTVDPDGIPVWTDDGRKPADGPSSPSDINTPGVTPQDEEPSAEDEKSYAQLQKEAEARAKREQKKANLKTARRYAANAADMDIQIKTLKDALYREFKRSRKQNISDINKMLEIQLGQWKKSAEAGAAQFLSEASDTEQATGGVLESGFANLVRERADSLTAILEQGAGETDAIRAMLVNARNWHANANEANRTYYDTMQSINRGIGELNVDVQTGMANAFMYAEGERERIWQDFYSRRSEAMSRLGDIYGTQASVLDQAEELGLKDLTGRQSKARKGMKKYYAAASNELGKSYVQRDLPEWIDEYEGTAPVERRQENTNLASAPIFEGVQKAEGATLRTWAS